MPYERIVGLLIVPFVVAYFLIRNQLSRQWWLGLAAAYALCAAVVALLPVSWTSASSIVMTLHLPVALLTGVALTYTGAEWRLPEARLRAIKFAGEWFVLYVLVMLGVGVLLGLFSLLSSTIGLSLDELFTWLAVVLAVAPVAVTAAIASSASSFVSGACQILVKLFVPLFTLMLSVFLILGLASGALFRFQRDLLLILDVVLIVVTALVGYHIASRDAAANSAKFELLTFALVSVAAVIDVGVLTSMLIRVSDIGLSLNRSVAIGLNLVLLINLSAIALRYWRFVRVGADYSFIQRWQARYLYVFFAWAGFAAFVLPALFRFA